MSLVLCLLCLLLPAAAQSAGAGPDTQIAVGAVLRGRFVQERHLKGFDNPLRSEGRFVLVPGKGLIWWADKPFAVVTVVTAAGVRQKVGDDEILNMSSAKLPFLGHLYAMLSSALGGDWRALDGDFEDVRSGDNQHWRLELTPRHVGDPLALPFSGIAVDGSQFVDTVTMTKPGGDADVLTFSDQKLGHDPISADEAAMLDAAGQ